MHIQITASMLYNLVQCPHRLNLDLHEDPQKKDPESKFVELLWERGIDFENEVIESLQIPFTDLQYLKDEEREKQTREAMDQKAKLIHGGRIRVDNLLGEPDILRWDDNMGYVAGDIKSGSGEEGDEGTGSEKLKKHYAVQLALYTDILEVMGMGRGRLPFVWDIHGDEVIYDLNAQQGPRTPQTHWELYQEKLSEAHKIVSKPHTTLPALGATCKLCHWRSLCTDLIEKMDDLTLIAELGRAKRDLIMPQIRTVSALAKIDLSAVVQGNKTTIKEIGLSTLRKFQTRARLMLDPNGRPYCTTPLNLPDVNRELFFDIEVDPMRDICYLHGFIERHNRDNSTERFLPFIAETPTPEEEQRAFAKAWEYVKSCQPCAIYFYSKYERTWWRKLQQRYPSVATEEDINRMFASNMAVDLYFDVVQKYTEWPTRDHSIKTLAHYLGFKWRDSSPSGADSIEWYHRWIENGDSNIRQRILDYNQDDCVATRVLLDAIRKLKLT
jgi:predicted RecB family nuclease